jgi:glycosyltransferase EpsD
MKILYVTTISNTVNAFLIPHIQFLIEQGNQVDVAFNIEQEVNPRLMEMGCKIHRVPFQRSPIKMENYIAFKQIRRIVKEEGYELIHTHTPVASFVTRLACRDISGIKVIYTAHGFHFYKGAPKRNWAIYYTMEKMAARWTDGIITINEEDYQSAKKMQFRKGKAAVYKVDGVGIDLNRFVLQTVEKKMELRREYGYQEDDFLVVYAGELSYRKHQDLLIDAVHLLKGKIPNIKLLLAGSGPLRDEYKNQALQLGVNENIDFLGYRSDIDKLLMLSDLAVSSSRQEGLPVNVMEAMATGLPLVVTDSRGNRDLVRNGENGMVVGIDDREGLARAIQDLYRSESLRVEFSRKNQEAVKRYALERIVHEMGEIYRTFIVGEL